VHETLLIGTRGKIPAPAQGTQPDSVFAASIGEHSAKPEVFAWMIERLYPTVPKIELFCRGKPRPGWRAWGNEAEP
jgi:N6-adenosine-specific RNA methylase IME4